MVKKFSSFKSFNLFLKSNKRTIKALMYERKNKTQTILVYC